MEKELRKQLPNYFLPSEGGQFLQTIAGKTIKKLKSGIWHDSLERLLEKKDIPAKQNLMAVSHGGPLFISFEPNIVFVFQSDEFTESIVFRTLDVDVDNENFLEELYKEDYYFPDYLRVKTIIDLDKKKNIIGKMVKAIRILKLPDSYYSRPKNGIHRYEVAVLLQMEDLTEILLAYRMGKTFNNGHHILRWEEVAEDFPVEELSCIYQYPEED